MPESPEQLRARLRAEIAAIEKGVPKPSRAAISALSAASMSALDATIRYFFLPLLGAGVNDSFSAGRSMTGIL